MNIMLALSSLVLFSIAWLFIGIAFSDFGTAGKFDRNTCWVILILVGGLLIAIG